MPPKLRRRAASLALSIAEAGCAVTSPLEAPSHPDVVAAPAPEQANAGTPPTITPRGGFFQAAPPADDERRLKGVRRGAVAVREIDYEALPILRPSEETAAPSVRLEPKRVVVRGDLLAEIQIGSFLASTGGPYSAGNAPGCGDLHEGFLQARWSGFAARTWRDDRMTVLSAEGLFDKRTCEASAARAGTVDAKAVVPGFVYAWREAAPADLMPGESLVVLLPFTTSVSVGMSPDRAADAVQGSGYTRVSLPVERGSGRAFVARLTPASFAAWKQLRATKQAAFELPQDREASPLLLGVDVSWEGDRRRATLQVSLAEGAEKEKRAYAPFLKAAGVER